MDMIQIGHAVAAYMGDKYTATKYKNAGDNTIVIRNLTAGSDPAFGIVLTHDSYYKKISISGTYPVASDGWEFPSSSDQVSSLKVTETKKPHLIARDIKDKFLPAYWEVFQDAVVNRHAHEQYLLKRDGLAARFAKILHGWQKKGGTEIEGGPSISSKNDKRGWVSSFSVSVSDNAVDMDLHNVPADMAEKMLAVWLEGWKPECRNCHEFLDDRDICQNPQCSKYGKNGMTY